jgi:hypothetical protein
MAMLAEAPAQIDVLVEMSFHPQNTFVGMPLYQAAFLAADGEVIPPRQIARYPRFGPRPESSTPALPAADAMPVLGDGQPILGGTIVAAFDGRLLNVAGRQDLVVLDGTNELTRVAIELGKMR